jgi:ribonuclease G
VLAELNKALRATAPRSRSRLLQLGLVEMTRKRTRESLAHMLCETCPACKAGPGQDLAHGLLRDPARVMREAKQFNPREFRILASQEVVDMFLEEESQHLAMLGTSSASRSRCRWRAITSRSSTTSS